jgi:hypothetical protein
MILVVAATGQLGTAVVRKSDVMGLNWLAAYSKPFEGGGSFCWPAGVEES